MNNRLIISGLPPSAHVLGVPILISIGLLPLYVWESGGLQPAHFALIACAFIIFITAGASIHRTEGILIFLILIVGLREGVAVLEHGNYSALVNAFYLLFSLMVFNLSRRIPALGVSWYVASGVFVAVGVAIVGLVILGDRATNSSGLRTLGTFNNPNQLGYFAVCVLSLAYCLRLTHKLHFTLLIILLTCATFLAALSLSKAAMVSVLVGLLGVGFVAGSKRASMWTGIFFLAFSIALAIFVISSGYAADLSAAQRLADIGSQDDDSLAGRGYVALLDHGTPAVLFGHGYVDTLQIVGHEVHSTIFSFFVNYGIIAGIAFLAFLVAWAAKIHRSFGLPGVALIALPPMLYGLTHNGSRFSIFWILVGFSFGCASRITKD